VHAESAQSTPTWQARVPTQLTVHVVAPAQRTPSRHGWPRWVHTTSQGTPVGHVTRLSPVPTIRQTSPAHVPPAAPHTASQVIASGVESPPEHATSSARARAIARLRTAGASHDSRGIGALALR
jgi:hypothetical protein